jgi:GDPmannose 4,6-dehydratase
MTDGRALVTGAGGQDGRYLVQWLLAKGYEVYGMVRGVEGGSSRSQCDASPPRLFYVGGDLTDLPSLLRAMHVAQPDEVYNLASMSQVSSSWATAQLTTDVNAKGVVNILEAIRLYEGDDVGKVRFFQASSSEMFGKVQEVPQRETTLPWPRSPYGVAKTFGHHITVNYRESYGMHASSGILFNHESPRRPVDFVTRKISRAVARISLGLQDELVLGNLDVERDWGFAGDYVEAMWLMLQQDEPDDYVIATGETHSLRELLDTAFRVVGIDDWARYVRQDPAFMRPADAGLTLGDASKAREVLGWKPRVTFEELVTMMVEHDLAENRH